MKTARFDSQIPAPRSAATLTPSAWSVRGEDDFAGRRYGQAIWNRKWTVVAFAFLGAIGGATVALQKVPFYRAQSTMEILPANEAQYSGSDANIDYFLRTEVERLRSRNL